MHMHTVTIAFLTLLSVSCVQYAMHNETRIVNIFELLRENPINEEFVLKILDKHAHELAPSYPALLSLAVNAQSYAITKALLNTFKYPPYPALVDLLLVASINNTLDILQLLIEHGGALRISGHEIIMAKIAASKPVNLTALRLLAQGGVSLRLIFYYSQVTGYGTIYYHELASPHITNADVEKLLFDGVLANRTLLEKAPVHLRSHIQTLTQSSKIKDPDELSTEDKAHLLMYAFAQQKITPLMELKSYNSCLLKPNKKGVTLLDNVYQLVFDPDRIRSRAERENYLPLWKQTAHNIGSRIIRWILLLHKRLEMQLQRTIPNDMKFFIASLVIGQKFFDVIRKQ